MPLPEPKKPDFRKMSGISHISDGTVEISEKSEFTHDAHSIVVADISRVEASKKTTPQRTKSRAKSKPKLTLDEKQGAQYQ